MLRYLLLLTLAACRTVPPPVPPAANSDVTFATSAITARAMLAHLVFLADDALEGRGTGARGHEVAARYVAAQLAMVGAEPAGDGGTFFQSVPLRELTRDEAGSSLTLEGASGARKLQPNDEVLVSAWAEAEELTVSGRLVYVGFALPPEAGTDDLAGVDLKGAIAVVLAGAPPSITDSTTRAVMSDLNGKTRRLAARGAVAVIQAHTPINEKVRPWERSIKGVRFPRMVWTAGGRPGSGVALPMASVSLAGFDAMLAHAGAPGREVLWKEAVAGRARAFALGSRATLVTRSKHRELTSPNVLGVIRGSDPRLAAEHVVFSAHLDHLGIGEPVEGDAIYNGALDDAAGCAALLEIARAFASLPTRPARSILFLFTTAEEKGLLGADYYTEHPTVPLGSIVANINSDGPSPLWDFQAATVLGAEHSTLAAHSERAARAMGIQILPDDSPEQVYFIRSDQYPFVQKGIPAIFPGNHVGQSEAAKRHRALADDWVKKHYHQPSDHWRPEYLAEAMAREARFYFLIGLSVARAAERPTWNPGSIFTRL